MFHDSSELNFKSMNPDAPQLVPISLNMIAHVCVKDVPDYDGVYVTHSALPYNRSATMSRLSHYTK